MPQPTEIEFALGRNDERRSMGVNRSDIQDVKEAKLAESITMNVDDKGEVENYSQASDLHD